ncbi:MAG: ectoine hydroxylase-related dioxygenase (phytanoyl-CoA dioxygenase family) [Candidatus Azotimanducaceae bacterium]|jgi:ectoine hydroxylase-related dioxygenase (phytanoyl-CoA dioxygenase family)
MALQELSANAPLTQMLDALKTDGGLVIKGMFATDLITAMHAAIVDAAPNFAPGSATQGLGEDGKSFVGAQTIRFSSLGKITPAYFEMLDNPLYAALADAVLLPYCGSYWVNTGQAMLIGPGSKAQELHRDDGNWPHVSATNWPNSPEVTLSAMIALETITDEMGATRVIPGSHVWPNYKDNGNPSMTCTAEMQPGDALIYTGKLVHGGGANQTHDRWRHALHLSFVVGWLTPEECSPLDYTDIELARQSVRVQRLLGHRSYDPRPHAGGGLWLRHVNKIEGDD